MTIEYKNPVFIKYSDSRASLILSSKGTVETPITGEFKEEIYIDCNDRKHDIGLRINTKSSDPTLKFKKLIIRNIRVGLLKFGDGEVEIEELIIRDFGSDALNIRGSNLWVGKLNVYNCKPTRPYNPIKTTNEKAKSSPDNPKIVECIRKILSDCGEPLRTKDIKRLNWKKSTKLNANGVKVNVTEEIAGRQKQVYISDSDHIDAGLQAYYGDPDDTSSRSRRGKVTNIKIEEVKIYVDSPVAQVFALTEGSHYENFKIGEKSLDVTCAHKYWFIANTLVNSNIGNENAVVLCSKHIINREITSEIQDNHKYWYEAPGGTTPAICDQYPKVRIASGTSLKPPFMKATLDGVSLTKNVKLIGIGLSDDFLNMSAPEVPLDGSVELLDERNPSLKACPLRHFKNNTLEENLRFGDRDNIDEISQVGELQRFLNELGYNAGYIDLDYGNRTKKAVEAFQQDHFKISDGTPLIVDGIIGDNTRDAINNYATNDNCN